MVIDLKTLDAASAGALLEQLRAISQGGRAPEGVTRRVGEPADPADAGWFAGEERRARIARTRRRARKIAAGKEVAPYVAEIVERGKFLAACVEYERGRGAGAESESAGKAPTSGERSRPARKRGEGKVFSLSEVEGWSEAQAEHAVGHDFKFTAEAREHVEGLIGATVGA